jgi:hypothetical protein
MKLVTKSKNNIFIHEYLAEMVSRTDYMHRFSKHNDIRDFASCDLDLPVTLSLIKILFSSKYDSCDLHMQQWVSMKLKLFLYLWYSLRLSIHLCKCKCMSQLCCYRYHRFGMYCWRYIHQHLKLDTKRCICSKF